MAVVMTMASIRLFQIQVIAIHVDVGRHAKRNCRAFNYSYKCFIVLYLYSDIF